MIQLMKGDCLERMKEIPSGSVDMVLTDPPYFNVKPDQWDRQWKKADDFLAWMGKCAEQWARVLKPNGSIYVFASPQMAAHVEVKLRERFSVLNHIVWVKGAGWAKKTRKESLRAYFPQTERIIFAEHYNSDQFASGESRYHAQCDELRGFVFEPLRAYLDGERERAGFTPGQCNKALGNQMAGHYFTRSQWALPTKKNYEKLREAFNASGGEYLRKDYEELRKDYEELRKDYEELRKDYEELRRPFAVTKETPYTDVWTFKPVQSYPGKHPCEKPQPMLRHIITASTKPGAVVLDSFMGGGSTGVACVNTGRNFIGIEMDDHYFEVAERRIMEAQQ